MLDELAVHIAYIIAHALENDIEKIEVAEDAEEAWVQTIIEKGTGGAALGGEGCTPGYYNNEGKPNPLFAQAAPYGGGPIPFFNILKEWRDSGNFAGLEFNNK